MLRTIFTLSLAVAVATAKIGNSTNGSSYVSAGCMSGVNNFAIPGEYMKQTKTLNNI
jgi:hypothetical protein